MRVCCAPQVLPDKRMADKKSSVERGVHHQASLTWTASNVSEAEEHHSVDQVPAHMLPTIGIAKRRVRTHTKLTPKAHTRTEGMGPITASSFLAFFRACLS